MADFLFEIGLEEVPARMLARAGQDLLRGVVELLTEERLIANAEFKLEQFGDAPVKHRYLNPELDAALDGGWVVRTYSTPRRLAIHVKGVAVRQADLEVEVMGPSAKIAFNEGIPGPAAIAFAKKSGVPVESLTVSETAKGPYVRAKQLKPGRSAAEVLVEGMPKVLAGIYWAKNMYWRAGKPERFVRPVRWLVALLDDEVVPVSFGGYTAGRETFGHRVLYGAEPITISSPAAYVDQLAAASVMADVELRRHTIRKALDHVCRTIPDTRWREDHALVDKMTHMTEWPSVIAGAFEPGYLALPEEVLVTVMRDHQNYFAVESSKPGQGVAAPPAAPDTAGPGNKLAPHFLAVLNTVADEAGQAVIRHGNERVLRARFNDARFFWEFDQRIPLEDRVTLLANVTFQKDLGSYALKSERIAGVAKALSGLVVERGMTIDEAALSTAARLAKTDLTTELVKEFTELQGEVGGLYARAQSVPEAAAAAIYDHYRPTSMEDRIPHTIEGQVLAIADKADTIAGMFSLGMEPTGSKDPFALRRAANGIVKILAEGSLPLTLADVISASGAREEVAAKMQGFFAERVEFYLREAKAQAYDVVKAVLAIGSNDVRDAVARAEAVTAVRGSEDFRAVSAAFKRMKNILAQAGEKGFEIATTGIGFSANYEMEFWAAVQTSGAKFRQDFDAKRYEQALSKLAKLRVPIDNYFADTMITVDDASLRANRLGMLQYLKDSFSLIADYSEIVVAGS